MKRAQACLWAAEAAAQRGDLVAAASLRRKLGDIHAELAASRLRRGDDGWIDLYAAITAYGEAHAWDFAREQIRVGRELASKLPRVARKTVEDELRQHEAWLEELLRREAPPTRLPGLAALVTELLSALEEPPKGGVHARKRAAIVTEPELLDAAFKAFGGRGVA